jgi:putative tricarboxylic transport membrane protein
MTPGQRHSSHERHEGVNVREDLVGDAEAERLGIEDDRRTAVATMALGALLLLMGVVVLVQATRLRGGSGPVDAATAPWAVGALLLVVGVLMVRNGRRDLGVWEYSEHTTGQDWVRMGALLLALVVFAAVVGFLGFVVSSTLLFGATAIALGSPHRARPFAYGFCIAALVFLVFDSAIGLSLPAGPWGF